ncbi:MAG: small multi-drug export protein [Patescibacteria group bacterium]
MIENLIIFFQNIPAELAVVILSSLPLTELRASLPLALTVFDIQPISALILVYIGNIIPMFIILYLLPFLVIFVQKKSRFFDRILNQYFLHLEKKHKDRYDRYGSIVLIIFVAIPLPGSGVWTGSIISVLFGIQKKYSIPAITVGMLISGLVVFLLTQSGISLFS